MTKAEMKIVKGLLMQNHLFVNRNCIQTLNAADKMAKEGLVLVTRYSDDHYKITNAYTLVQ